MERAVQPPGLFGPPPPQQQQQQQPAFAPGTAIHPPGAVPRTPAVYPPPGSAYPQYHHELNNPIQGPFTTTAAPLPHRGPERNPQIEPGFYQESSSPAWGPISPAQSNGTSLNGTGPSPGLGTPTDDQESNAASPDQCARRQRKKQKRNKPTLSCYECVDRKTKCDRGRPNCLACIKRSSKCVYGHVATLLEETTLSATNGRLMTNPPLLRSNGTRHTMPNVADRGFNLTRHQALGSVATSAGLLSNVPFSAPGSSNVFGIGSEHPFANFWTCNGGLPEVIRVLPGKAQADLLLDAYFQCVDPVYPLLHRQTFYADWEQFWSWSNPQEDCKDASFIALVFIMMALGMQFNVLSEATQKKNTAEFYASASNQALRMCSYLSVASLKTIQTMVLMTYFLINDDHASDGWAFAGVLVRQSYAMGLHRDPDIVVPEATPFEKQQRRKVWQAVLLQDTFLTVLLSLPPNATHTDVNVNDLVEDDSSIGADNPADTAYIRGSWTLANLVQKSICSPRCLDIPICQNARQKSRLVAEFKAVYRSFPDAYRSWDSESLGQLAQENKRVVLQTLFLSSNYHHNLMLVHGSESSEVEVNVRGTLQAAHEAIKAFFVLFELFESDARVWWVFNHRAFLEALCIGNALKQVVTKEGSGVLEKDVLYGKARNDIHRMITIMEAMSQGPQGSQTAKTRVQVLGERLL